MYTVTNAFGISRAHESRWQNLNLSTTPVHDIFSLYRKVYLTITAPSLQDPIFVDMESFVVDYSYFTGTLTDLMTELGNSTLVTIPELPEINTKYAYYSDAFRAGYKAEIVGRTSAFGAAIPRSDRKDLRLVRQDVDMEDVYKHCLVSVNGFFHVTDTDTNYLYVLDGGSCSLKSRQNQVGLWSFKNIGELKTKPIVPEMIFNQGEDSAFSDRAYIHTREDVSNKTVWLVLGGYLVRPQKDIFFPVGNNSFCVNMGNLPLLQRYYEALPYLDFSRLGLDTSTVNSDQISLEQFYSNLAIRGLLTMSQSFLIIIDKQDLFFNKNYLRHSNLPGMFTAYSEPKQPLFTGYGKLSEYWKAHEDGQWAINVQDSFLQNKVFNSVTRNMTEMVSANNTPERTFYNSRGYLLEVGCDI